MLDVLIDVLLLYIDWLCSWLSLFWFNSALIDGFFGPGSKKLPSVPLFILDNNWSIEKIEWNTNYVFFFIKAANCRLTTKVYDIILFCASYILTSCVIIKYYINDLVLSIMENRYYDCYISILIYVYAVHTMHFNEYYALPYLYNYCVRLVFRYFWACQYFLDTF